VSTPLTIITVVVLLYLMWVKRDVWIPRLLTSNNRVRRPSSEQEEKTLKDLGDSSSYSPPTTSSKGSPSDSFSDEDDDEDSNEDNDDQTNDQGTPSDNEEDSTPSHTKSSSSQKLNIRIRRNKMSFSKDRQKKKQIRLANQTVDEDVGGDDDYEEDDKSNESKKTSLPLPNQQLGKHHHATGKNQQRPAAPSGSLKAQVSSNSSVRLPKYDDIIEQLRKNLQSRSKDRDFLSTMIKTTGLNKDKLHRFIYKKDYDVLTLQTFLSLLKTFNLTLLVVPT
jgi:hypothetical protein